MEFIEFKGSLKNCYSVDILFDADSDFVFGQEGTRTLMYLPETKHRAMQTITALEICTAVYVKYKASRSECEEIDIAHDFYSLIHNVADNLHNILTYVDDSELLKLIVELFRDAAYFEHTYGLYEHDSDGVEIKLMYVLCTEDDEYTEIIASAIFDNLAKISVINDL